MLDLKEFKIVFRNDKYLQVDNWERIENAPIFSTVYDDETKRILAFCTIEDFDKEGKGHVGRLTIGVLPDFQGKKYGEKVLRLSIEQAFYHFGKTKIWLSTYADNISAVRLYEKVGFRVEGVFRNEVYDTDLGYRNVYSMALIPDWYFKSDKIEWGIPSIGAKEVDNLLKCVDTDWYTSGPQVKEVEKRIATVTGAKYNFLVNNGTSALLGAYATIKYFTGVEDIIIPNFTFQATYNVAKELGFSIQIVDVDPKTGLIDLEQTRKALRTWKTKLIVPVSVSGSCNDYDELTDLRNTYICPIIEDSAAALGGEHINGTKIGSFADITCFSLHASKVVTGIEGGIITTNSEEYAKFISEYISHGEDKKQKYHFVHSGLNLRPTDMVAGIFNAQLDKLYTFLSHRTDLVNKYHSNLGSEYFLQIPDYQLIHPHMFCLFLAKDKPGLISYLKEHNIDSRPSWYGITQDKEYKNSNFLGEHGIQLPLHNKLTFEEVDKVCEVIKEYEK